MTRPHNMCICIVAALKSWLGVDVVLEKMTLRLIGVHVDDRKII